LSTARRWEDGCCDAFVPDAFPALSTGSETAPSSPLAVKGMQRMGCASDDVSARAKCAIVLISRPFLALVTFHAVK